MAYEMDISEATIYANRSKEFAFAPYDLPYSPYHPTFPSQHLKRFYCR